MILKLAFKNIIRQLKRTLLTVSIFAFALMIFISMLGLVNGMIEKSNENLLDLEIGHHKIRSNNYDKDDPFNINNTLTQYETTLNKLSSTSFISAATGRLSFIAEIDNLEDMTSCVVLGIDEKTDKDVFNLFQFIYEGDLVSDGAVIGKQLARDMKIKVNDTAFITFKRKDKSMDSVEFVISGIIDSPNPMVNNGTIIIGLAKAQELIGANGVTEISIKTKDYNNYNQNNDVLKTLFPNYQVKDWKELTEPFGKAGKADRAQSYFFLFFLSIIGVVGIINTMIMSILEKKTEIGLFRALGFTRIQIIKLVITEGAMIGCIGSFFGVVFGCLVNTYYVTYGMDISQFFGDTATNIGYRIMGVIYAVWPVSEIIGAVIACILLSILASIIPARRAANMNPVDSLRVIQ